VHEYEETRGLATLLRRHASIGGAFVTSRTVEKEIELEGRTVRIIPSAAYCYIVGRNITARLDRPLPQVADEEPVKKE
jgi:hypothetical protein